ncbi:hypothetical protein [Szabonella alba]|uniref:Uncharacterized protein n=1 Tax=Szabonella alba TaxID=2804194 RepID=A0A8K0V5R1_9RHOB|nr:hypothetical protein [Szabonella alba]MBL4915937.1 hypothetical protein [Szabonella alba]
MTPAAAPCPGCGADVVPNPRYPGRFCDDCLSLRATDGTGARLQLVEDLRAGIGWRREGESGWQAAAIVLCLIAGRPAAVHGARFGGLVALPADSDALPRPRGQTDLTG